MKKKFMIVGVIFMAMGLALFAGAAIAFGFDFSKLDAAKYETDEYIIEEDFQKIDIISNETDIRLKPSDDGKTKIVCVELETVKHSVSVADGTLNISAADQRKWYEFFNLHFKSLSITVYLPSVDYAAVTVNGRTGDIRIENIVANQINLSVSTGSIALNNVACGGNISVNVSTGDTRLTDVDCKNFISEGSTGNVTLKNVVATENFTIKRSTGNIRFENCDAGEIVVKTSTGNVTGTFRTEKVFIAKTSTGTVKVPPTTAGGKCEITTSPGDIKLDLI